MAPPVSLLPLKDSYRLFHYYTIRCKYSEIELYQDGNLVASKRAHQNSREETKMKYLGYWLSKYFFRGKMAYIAYYKNAVAESDLVTIHSKLQKITEESNIDLIKNAPVYNATSRRSRQRSRSSDTDSAADNSVVTPSSQIHVQPVKPVEPKPIAPVTAREPKQDGSSVWSKNGSIYIDTQPLHDMLRKANGTIVVHGDTINVAVTGICVVANITYLN